MAGSTDGKFLRSISLVGTFVGPVFTHDLISVAAHDIHSGLPWNDTSETLSYVLTDRSAFLQSFHFDDNRV